MTRVTFSVIVPTSGRATLRHALDSIASQLEPGDEIIVVCNQDGDFGNAARNSGIERARGSHLVFLDDDDEYLPGAFSRMRKAAAEHPDRVILFPQHREVYGDTPPSTVGSVFPNVPGKVGRFEPPDPALIRPLRPGETTEYLTTRWGDWEFKRSTLELLGEEPVHVPVPTYVLRPEKNAWRRLRFRLKVRSRLRSSLERLSSKKS
jgi:glycosyltransferase involved in cell wall biosynthesis